MKRRKDNPNSLEPPQFPNPYRNREMALAAVWLVLILSLIVIGLETFGVI